MQDFTSAMDACVLAASIILQSSGETYRAEDTVLRMSKAFGIEAVDILAFPTGFTMVFTLPDRASQSRVHRIKERSLRLSNINEVNTISRLVVNGKLDADAALVRLNDIINRPKPKPALFRLFFALASGFFCVMFGGRHLEFIISFICGYIMQSLMPLYIKFNAPSILISLFSGAVASLIAVSLSGQIGANQDPIIAGAIMPLIPGLAMTNAIRDTMRGDLVSGLARGAEALLCAIAIAAGVAVIVFI